ncbi:protein kinase [Aspergillus crustosus]
MATIPPRTISLFRALTHCPWPASTVVAPRLALNEPIEEEHTPYYDPARFYPARVGDVLNNRYQLATKLGYGSCSTIWLARDLNHEKYVALEINSSAHHSRANAAEAELDILKHSSEANPLHKGWGFVHLAIAFEPLREPLWIYRQRFIGEVIPPAVLKILLQMVLHGIDYLHSECHVIHADLKPDNTMIEIEDTSLLENSARDEYNHPLPQKIYPSGRTIYLSRNDFGIPEKTTVIIQITDFDLSVPEIYRAFEVILDAGYSYSADIWSSGVMLWDLLEGRKLLKDIDPLEDQAQEYGELDHLCQRSALLGPPPKGLLDKGAKTHGFYASNDEYIKSSFIAPSTFSFENSIHTIHGEDKRMFIEAVQMRLKWRPEERSTAEELLQNPWLHAEFDEN